MIASCAVRAAALARDPLLEVRAGGVRQTTAGCLVHERVGIALFASRQPFPQIGYVRVRGQENVARQGAQGGEALLEVLDDVRIGRVLGEAEVVGGDRGQTIGVHHIQAVVLVAGLPGPRRAPRRMAGREMGCQRERADVQRFTILDDSYVSDRLNGRELPILRIVTSRMPRLQRKCRELARRHGSAAQPMQLRYATRVIEVHVRVENEFDVFDPEAERLDVGDNLRAPTPGYRRR